MCSPWLLPLISSAVAPEPWSDKCCAWHGHGQEAVSIGSPGSTVCSPHMKMLRLQGLPGCFSIVAETAGVSERQLCQMIGNAMSVNVLVVILSRLFPALGLS